MGLYADRINALRDVLRPVGPVANVFAAPGFADRLNAAVAKINEQEVATLYERYFKDGKWEELIGKPADEISANEYKTLALIYLNLSDAEASRFINKCLYAKKSDLLEIGHAIGMTPQGRTMLAILKPLIEKQCLVESAIGMMKADEIYAKYGKHFPAMTADELKLEIRDAIRYANAKQLLRYTALNEVSQAMFRTTAGYMKANKPFVDVKFGVGVHTCTINGYGSGLMGPGFHSDYAPKTIDIRVATGKGVADNTIETLDNYISAKAGYSSGGVIGQDVANASLSLARNKTIEQAVGTVLAKTGEKTISAVGTVTTFGAGLIFDISVDLTQAETDLLEAANMHKVAVKGTYANDFGMTAAIVHNGSGAHVECYPSWYTDQIRDYLNYVITKDKFWAPGNVYEVTQADQIKARQKLNELFAGEVTMKDILERHDDVMTLLDSLPANIKVEIIDDGGTANENR
jgi:hypothetical protein